MLYLVLIMLVALLSLWVVLISNIFFWWGVFLLMTVLIVFINKKCYSCASIFNYFVLQESLGMLFLLLFFGVFPMFIIMLKVGMAPFHFWVFKVVSNMYGFNLVWFLTIHKLPFLLVFLQLYEYSLFYLLLLGILFCFFQMFVMKVFKKLLVLSSVESFNWIVLGLVMSFVNVMCLFFYYMVLMMILIFKFDLLKSVVKSISWEMVFVFMNMPFTVSFFIKIFTLMEVLKSSGVYMMVMVFMMFLSVISLSLWLMVVSTSKLLFSKYSYGMIFMLVAMTMVIVM